MVMLEGVATYFDSAQKEKRILHAVGEDTSIKGAQN
jgi:hypothetical protein